MDEQEEVTALFHRGNLQLTQNIAFHVMFLSPLLPYSVAMLSMYAVS